jgi:hypothetical protein
MTDEVPYENNWFKSFFVASKGKFRTNNLVESSRAIDSVALFLDVLEVFAALLENLSASSWPSNLKF